MLLHCKECAAFLFFQLTLTCYIARPYKEIIHLLWVFWAFSNCLTTYRSNNWLVFIQALIWINKGDDFILYSDREKLLIRSCFFYFYCSLNDDKSTWLPVWLFFSFFFFWWGGGTSITRTPTLTPIKEIMSLKERKTTSECDQCDCFWPGHGVPCNSAWPQQEAMNSETKQSELRGLRRSDGEKKSSDTAKWKRFTQWKQAQDE